MYYEINVSLNNRHLFATHERSLTNIGKTRSVYDLLKEKFPESEGYKIEVSYWKKIGKRIDFDNK